MALIEVPSASTEPPRAKPPRSTVSLHGELDLSEEAELATTLARSIGLDDAGLVIDLSDVSFMSASAVGVILRTQDYLQHRGQTLAIRAPSRCARRILVICGLDGFIETLEPDHANRDVA